MKKLFVAILLFVPVLASAAAPAKLLSCTANTSVSGHVTWKGVYDANGQSYVFLFQRPCPQTVQVK